MKLCVLLLSVLFSSICFAHGSIGKEDLVGEWDSIDRSQEWVPSMKVTEAGEIIFSRTTIHSSGHELRAECRSNLSKAQSIEGVFIIPCSNTKKSGGNLVFSGWVRDGVTKIVGMFYQLYLGEPNKAVPVALERRGATDNKSLNTDASDAGAG